MFRSLNPLAGSAAIVIGHALVPVETTPAIPRISASEPL